MRFSINKKGKIKIAYSISSKTSSRPESNRSPSLDSHLTTPHQKGRRQGGITLSVDVEFGCLSFSHGGKAGVSTSPCLVHSSPRMRISTLPRLTGHARRQVRAECNSWPLLRPSGRETLTCVVRKVGQSIRTKQPESLTAVFLLFLLTRRG